MRRLLIAFAALLSGFAAFAYTPSIRDIDVSVRLQKNGTANVTEVWNVVVADGTEWYLVRSNLGDIEVGNLRVSDENGHVFVNEGEWNVDRSLSQKAGRCGIVHKRGGAEICWGVGSYGPHTYTVSYTMTNVVKSLTDADMMHVQLVSPGLSGSPEHVKATVKADGISKDNTRFWGFGFEGQSAMDGNCVIFESKGRFNSLIVLLRFEKGIFNSSSVQNRGFEDVLAGALEGAHFEDEDDGDGWFATMLSFIFMLLPVIIMLAAAIYGLGYRKRILGCRYKDVMWSRDVPYGGNLAGSYYTLKRLGETKKGNTYASALILRMIYAGAIAVNKKDKDKVDLSFNDAKAGDLDADSRDLYGMMKEAAGSDEILQDKEFSKWSRKHYTRVNDWINSSLATGSGDLRKSSFLRGEKYTPEGQAEARKLVGFKKFLSDYTLISERCSRDVGLWQDYLVFGSLYGIADKVAKELHDIDPQFFEEVVTQDYNTMSHVLWQNANLSNAIMNAQTRAHEAMKRNSGSFGGFGGGTSFGGGGGFSGGGFGGGSR